MMLTSVICALKQLACNDVATVMASVYLLTVFLSMMHLYISAYCDIAQLEFCLKDDRKRTNYFCLLKDTYTNLHIQNNMTGIIYFVPS